MGDFLTFPKGTVALHCLPRIQHLLVENNLMGFWGKGEHEMSPTLSFSGFRPQVNKLVEQGGIGLSPFANNANRSISSRWYLEGVHNPEPFDSLYIIIVTLSLEN